MNPWPDESSSKHEEHDKKFSVQLNPVLNVLLEQEASRFKMTKSAFIHDILERALGYTNPSKLLEEICSGLPMGDPNASENVSEKVKAKLREKYSY